MWEWTILNADDLVGALRSAAAVAAAAGSIDKAAEYLDRASAVLSDGPDGEGAVAGSRREDAVAAWESEYGSYSDPEVRARVEAAGRALKQLEREQADAAAKSSATRSAKIDEARDRLNRRGRRRRPQ